MGYLMIVVRSLIMVGFMILITKIVGSKQISQLTFYDYVSGITIGSIAGAIAIDETMPIEYGLIALAVFALCDLLISFLTERSMFMRRVITGQAHMLIEEGVIMYKNLKRARLNVNDLLRELRNQGYFSVSDIQYAVFETNGKLSIMPKAYAKTVTVADLKLTAENSSLESYVIIDGKILKGNLDAMNKDEAWLKEQLKTQGYEEAKDIILGTLTEDGELSLFAKNYQKDKRTLLQ